MKDELTPEQTELIRETVQGGINALKKIITLILAAEQVGITNEELLMMVEYLNKKRKEQNNGKEL